MSGNDNSSNNRISSGSLSKLRGPGRPRLNPSCTWCGETKSALKYVLPTPTGRKEFCSETCIGEYRKSESKGSCQLCGNIVKKNSPNKDFCSTICLTRHQRKRNSSITTSGSSRERSPTNNNTINVSSNNNSARMGSVTTTLPSGQFQYESFVAFSWKNYLKVILTFLLKPKD